MGNRFDIYALVHKGLRAGLAGVVVRLGRADWHNAVIAERTIEAVREVLALCRAHLEIEDRHIHPALEGAQPGTTRRATLEHRQHFEAIAELEEEVTALSAASAAERSAGGAELYRRWVRFAAENFEHMAFEEEHHNPELWAAYSDDQLRTLQKVCVAGLPEPIELGFRRWIMAAINSDERARLPPPVHLVSPPGIPRAA